MLGTRSYFCEPFHSWEKGTVENSVGLVRRYFPKGADFTALTIREIKQPPRVRLVVTVFCNPWIEREAEGDARCRSIRRS